jgi:hypothetical protein
LYQPLTPQLEVIQDEMPKVVETIENLPVYIMN